MTDYFDLIREVDALIEGLRRHADPETRAQAQALLDGIDALHREGLARLAAALHEHGAGAALHQAAEDPVVRVLLGLYDIVPLELPPEEPAVTGFVPIERLTMRRSGS